ncbi:unnamed protein product [Rhizophagus irregularis]|nr:unnamed protein product [Rhizophagus irregularis]CAB4444140.1 unnamed protein product [Rhizophagus irregularis]
MRIFLTKSYSHFNKKPAEDLTKEMMMTLEKWIRSKSSILESLYVPQFIIKIMYLQRNKHLIRYIIKYLFSERQSIKHKEPTNVIEYLRKDDDDTIEIT